MPGQDGVRLLTVGIHDVRDAGDSGALLGQAHQILAVDAREIEVPGTGH